METIKNILRGWYFILRIVGVFAMLAAIVLGPLMASQATHNSMFFLLYIPHALLFGHAMGEMHD